MAYQDEFEVARRLAVVDHAHEVVPVLIVTADAVVDIPRDDLVSVFRRILGDFFSLYVNRVGLLIVSRTA
jgi:hypothetical protein